MALLQCQLYDGFIMLMPLMSTVQYNSVVQQYLGSGGAVLVLYDLVVERGSHANSSTCGRRGSPISTYYR